MSSDCLCFTQLAANIPPTINHTDGINRILGFGWVIENEIVLKSVVDHIFGDGIIQFFESMNNEYIDMGGIYPSSTYSYSYDSFRFLFLGCLKEYYDEIGTDLRKLYLEKMAPDRTINKAMYQSAFENLHSRKSK